MDLIRIRRTKHVWGGGDYDDEMRKMNEQEKAQKARLSLESKDGLNLNTTKVRRAADYTIKGAGSIKARTRKKRHTI